jgi:hypothetical protein
MKKLFKLWAAAALLAVTLACAVPAFAEETPAEPKSEEVKLTDEQKQELGDMHKKMLKEKRALINKYVEYGVMPQEKADKIMTRMEEHYTKMERNGFIPNWDHHDKKCDYK